jgi:hypothetical protein
VDHAENDGAKQQGTNWTDLLSPERLEYPADPKLLKDGNRCGGNGPPIKDLKRADWRDESRLDQKEEGDSTDVPAEQGGWGAPATAL